MVALPHRSPRRSLLVFILLALHLPARAGDDWLTTYGYSGLFNVPTASIVPEGYFDVHYNQDPLGDREFEEQSNFLFGAGLARGFELGGKLAYARGNGDGGRNDLSSAVKLRLVNRAHFDLAAGWADFSGESAGTQRFEARYLVGSFEAHDIALTLGWGEGPDRLAGWFGGAKWAPLRQVELLADHDGEFTQAGIRLHWDATDVARLYAAIKNTSAEAEANVWSVGSRFNLRAGRTQGRYFDPAGGSPWIDAWTGSGLRGLSVDNNTGGLPVVDGENAVFLQRQADSASAACAAADTEGLIEYRQSRYGIPLLLTQVNCANGRFLATTWQAQDWPRELALLRQPSRWPLGVELRLGLEERSFVGTDVGRLDYSTALQGSIRVQGPLGLGAYATGNHRMAETDDFRPDGRYDFYRVPNGLREYAGQLAMHPYPGLIGVGTLGRTYVDTIEYDFEHLEAAYHWGLGAFQTRAIWGKYRPAVIAAFPEHEIFMLTQRYWSKWLNGYIEVGGGNFFYNDSGTELLVSRYFGDASVTLFWRGKDEDEMRAGIAISVPLTPKRGLSLGPVSVVGMPRFTFAKSSTFNNDSPVNILRPRLLIEPRPVYNLLTDWLDSDRMFPDYLADSSD